MADHYNRSGRVVVFNRTVPVARISVSLPGIRVAAAPPARRPFPVGSILPGLHGAVKIDNPMTASPSFETRLVGRVLAGKYRLLRVQASGAFGTVFAAEQLFCRQVMRPVAVKVSRQTGLTEETAPHLFADALVPARRLAGDDPAGEDGGGRRHLVQIYDLG